MDHTFVPISALMEVQKVVGTSLLPAGLIEDWIWASWKLLSFLLAASAVDVSLSLTCANQNL